jgi:hypothetical protein
VVNLADPLGTQELCRTVQELAQELIEAHNDISQLIADLQSAQCRIG